MSKNSSGQVGDDWNVHPRWDYDSAILPPDLSRGLGSPRPGRRSQCLARVARGDQGRHRGDDQGRLGKGGIMLSIYVPKSSALHLRSQPVKPVFSLTSRRNRTGEKDS